MKKINFTKMAGAGNDFIIIEALPKINYCELTRKVCDRYNGIGADGLIILDKSKKADYRMRIINADGSEAEMCGNGARCMAAYIARNKKPNKKLFSMETLAGIILAQAKEETAIVKLSEPKDYAPQIKLAVNGKILSAAFINTGVPHAIIYVDNLANIAVSKIGPAIRYHDKFKPRGTNVNFVEQIKKDLVAIRTYERGVENETKACGTGSVAAALVTFLKSNPSLANKNKASMKVRTQSGEILNVLFDLKQGRIENVWLKGSAKFIAKGEYYV